LLYPFWLGPRPRNRFEWILAILPILIAAVLVLTTARAAGLDRAGRNPRRPNWLGTFLYPLAFVVYLLAGISMALQNELAIQIYSGPIQMWFGWRNPAVLAIVYGAGVLMMVLVNGVELLTRRLRR